MFTHLVRSQGVSPLIVAHQPEARNLHTRIHMKGQRKAASQHRHHSGAAAVGWDQRKEQRKNHRLPARSIRSLKRRLPSFQHPRLPSNLVVLVIGHVQVIGAGAQDVVLRLLRPHVGTSRSRACLHPCPCSCCPLLPCCGRLLPLVRCGGVSGGRRQGGLEAGGAHDRGARASQGTRHMRMNLCVVAHKGCVPKQGCLQAGHAQQCTQGLPGMAQEAY